MQVDPSNSIFEKAVSFVNHTNKHLFLTGKAGTGKTTFLKYIREHSFKKLAVVAPTGVAAINAGGVTIHSFFQLPFGTFIPNALSGWDQINSNVYNRNQLLGKLRIHRKKRDLIRELELLIIDEVSMVRADILDAMDTVLRSVRRKLHEPFGGLQMVYIGDLFQLPPVIKNQEWQLLCNSYSGPFFFNAHVIQEAPPLYLELKKIYRQDDPFFIQLLNNIRNNCCTSDDLDQLQTYYHPDFLPQKEEGFITLTTHNYIADQINERELKKLPGKTCRIKAFVEGDFPESAFPAEKILQLKKGAQIMFIKNDKGEVRRYFNGKMGVVDHIDEEENKLKIIFPDETEPLELEMEEWKNIRYKYDEQKDEVTENAIGSFKQFPIRLAWAVTIHKSQGLTFEKAVVDAGAAFAPGQVYVALSRLTGLKGLVLRSRITSQSIRTDERVIAFAKNELADEELDKTLEDAQQHFIEQSLLQAFRWEKLIEKFSVHISNQTFHSVEDKAKEMSWNNTLKETLLQCQDVAVKFQKQLQNLLRQHATGYDHLHQRAKAATDWFTKELNEKVIQFVRLHVDDIKARPRTKKRVRQLRELVVLFERKQQQLKQACTITEALLQAQTRSELMQCAVQMYKPKVSEIPKEEYTPKPKPVKGSSKRTSLEMFKKGLSVEEIAKERSLVTGTILSHLISFIPTGEVKTEELVKPEKITALTYIIKENPDALSSEIKAKAGDNFSYPEIKAVMLHLEKD